MANYLEDRGSSGSAFSSSVPGILQQLARRSAHEPALCQPEEAGAGWTVPGLGSGKGKENRLVPVSKTVTTPSALGRLSCELNTEPPNPNIPEGSTRPAGFSSH